LHNGETKMANIKGDLIIETGPDIRKEYPGAYADLETLKHGKPIVDANEITAKDLADHLRVIIGERVKAEIENDPQGMGYPVDDGQCADMLNNPITDNVARVNIAPARVNAILVGVPYAPNVLTADDVAEARKA